MPDKERLNQAQMPDKELSEFESINALDVKYRCMPLDETDMFDMHVYNLMSGEAESAKASPLIDDVLLHRGAIVEVMRIMCDKAAAQVLDESIENVPGELYCAFPVRMSMRHQLFDDDEMSHCEMGLKMQLQDAVDDLCSMMELSMGRGEAPQARAQVAYEIARHSSWNVNLVPVCNAKECTEALMDKRKRAIQQVGAAPPRGGDPFFFTPADVRKELLAWRQGLSDCWIKQHVMIGCSMAYSFAVPRLYRNETRTEAYLLVARTPMKGFQRINVDSSVVANAIIQGMAEDALQMQAVGVSPAEMQQYGGRTKEQKTKRAGGGAQAQRSDANALWRIVSRRRRQSVSVGRGHFPHAGRDNKHGGRYRMRTGGHHKKATSRL